MRSNASATVCKRLQRIERKLEVDTASGTKVVYILTVFPADLSGDFVRHESRRHGNGVPFDLGAN